MRACARSLGVAAAGLTSAAAADGVYLSQAWMAPYTFRSYRETTDTNHFALAGTAMGWHGDSGSYLLPLGFGFPYFGQSYTAVYVNVNGVLAFQPATGLDTPNLATLSATRMVAVLWDDLTTQGSANPTEDVYVLYGSDAVTIRWQAETRAGAGPINAALMLRTNGSLRFSYGSHNDAGGMIGLSGGEGHVLLSSNSQSGAMWYSRDIVFTPVTATNISMALFCEGLGSTDAFLVEACASLGAQPWFPLFSYSSGYGYGFGYGYGYGFYYSLAFREVGGGFEWSSSYTNSGHHLYYRINAQ